LPGAHGPPCGARKVLQFAYTRPRHNATNADGLLPERARHLASIDRDGVVGAAAVVAVKHHEALLAGVIPDDVTEPTLGIEIDVIGVFVGPGHGDDELGLRLDLAFLRLRIHREQRDEEKESDDLQALEEHEAEGIELLARIVTEAVHRALVRERKRRTPRSGRWLAQTPGRSPRRADNTASAGALTRSARSVSCTSRPPCRRSSGPWNFAPRLCRRHRGRRSGPASG